MQTDSTKIICRNSITVIPKVKSHLIMYSSILTKHNSILGEQPSHMFSAKPNIALPL